MAYVIMALIIWGGVYVNMAVSKQPMDVQPLRSIDDLFE